MQILQLPVVVTWLILINENIEKLEKEIKMKKELTNDDRLVLKAISIIQSEIANDESPLKGITNHVCNPNCRCN